MRCRVTVLPTLGIFAAALTPLVTPLAAAQAQSAAEPVNLARDARATASSEFSAANAAGRAIDGVIGNESRWLSKSGPGPHVLTLEFPAVRRIACIQMVTGWYNGAAWADPLSDFALEYRDGAGDWRPLPGASRKGSDAIVVSLPLSAPVDAAALRLTAAGGGTARVAEIRVFGPAADYPLPKLPTPFAQAAPEAPRPALPMLFVNQSGYDTEGVKRFTAPTLAEGAPFTIRAVAGGGDLFRGTVRGRIGDFTAFRPPESASEYVVLAGGLRSDAFRVAPLWLERVSLDPALRFMIDNRSVVGTHRSAYGGSPWRDGTYYSYEVPSLVLLYLAAPSFFDNAPVEMHHAADKSRVLAPGFALIPANGDAGALDAALGYYRNLDAPVGARVPDIIQLIHWGIGWHLTKPESRDPSGDPAGRRLHPQTVEQFAFFLYGYPRYRAHFTDRFYRQAHDFAFGQWEKAGLLDVITKVGDFKGRDAPGHSILPNLLMYEVAKREKRPDAARYLQAAVRQAAWLVTTLDAADPTVTKGQRMSEHMTVTGLTTLLRRYPASAPAGVRGWLSKWTDVMIARSNNLWDFRRYDDTDWTLPRFAAGSHGGAGWNEVGNVAGFPACALSVADVTADAGKAARLRQLASSHFDGLFGRNPLGAHAGRRGPRDYAGVERGWPRAFPDNVCARLELVRGTLNSTAATEHFPYNPGGAFRHPEGWTAFNAAFNVGLAVACGEATRLSVRPDPGGWQVELTAPFAGADGKTDSPSRDATVTVTTARGETRTLSLRPVPGHAAIRRGMILKAGAPDPKSAGAALRLAPGETVSLSYGYGLFAHSVTVTAPKRAAAARKG